MTFVALGIGIVAFIAGIFALKLVFSLLGHVEGTCWLRHDWELIEEGVTVWDWYARKFRSLDRRRCRTCGWTEPGRHIEGWGEVLTRQEAVDVSKRMHLGRR